MGSGASQPKLGELLAVPRGAEDILGSQTQRSQRVTSLEIDDTVRTAATAVLDSTKRSTRVTSLNMEDLGMNVETADSPVSHTLKEGASHSSPHLDGEGQFAS